MEKREEALREALARNADETARWESYQKENEQAIENLEAFSKRLVVDVMVPVGRKAFTHGQLIHTNEVMVGHYQGYFSKCTVHTAKKICEQRLRMAKEHLGQLNTEAELWNNKLEKPYLDGVLPNAFQQEIIEDYDEEKEKRWRGEHNLRVKQAKLREKEEMQKEIEAQEILEEKLKNGEVDNEELQDDVSLMLEKAEILEELKAELNKLEGEHDEATEDTLKKLMSGEMKLPPPKSRVAHKLDDGEVIFQNFLPGVVKKSELSTCNTPPTNNNFRVNPELLMQQIAANDNGNESDDSDSSVAPEEVQLIEEQAKFLPTSDRIGFYQYQMQIIEQKILTSTLANAEDIEQKLRLFKVREHLEELLEMAEETEGAAELAASEEIDEEVNEVSAVDETVTTASANVPQSQQKRRISFAFEDHTLEFRKHETVAEMLPKWDTSPPPRDVIKLDGFEHLAKPVQSLLQPTPPVVDKKQEILNKVEESFKHVTENQSAQDFDLVNKIIDNASGATRTLHIRFKHSTQNPPEWDTKSNANTTNDENEIPGSPADLYRIFVQSTVGALSENQPSTLFINAYEGEDQQKIPVLKEQDRQEAYKDLRAEFSNPSVSQSTSNVQSEDPADDAAIIKKSILRNKNAVDAESRVSSIDKETNKENTNKKSKKKKQAKQPLNEDECMSAYSKVMHDVVEKPLTEPESLPAGRYIDAHTPKQRVSRFKQMRAGVEKT